MNDNKNTSGPQLPFPDTAADISPGEYINDIPDYSDDITIETIIQKILTDDKQYDLSKIISAYKFAEQAHKEFGGEIILA